MLHTVPNIIFMYADSGLVN